MIYQMEIYSVIILKLLTLLIETGLLTLQLDTSFHLGDASLSTAEPPANA